MSDDTFRSAVGFLPAALHKLGFQTLRPGQDRVVFNLFAGKSVFCILPTGQGKSACYILPTICCQYRTLIFSPLISLMQDQVEQLWKLNLSAGQLSSGQTPAENNATIAQWMSGQLQFLLVAPERLDNADFNLAINHVRPDLIVVDEAHCFPGSAKLVTSEGPLSFHELDERVKSGKSLPKVLSFDGKHRIFKTITNFWRKGKRSLVTVKTIFGDLRCTADHKLATQRGWVSASDLVAGKDSLVCTSSTHKNRYIRRLNSDQEQIVLGSLLGDGSIRHLSNSTAQIIWVHGIEQREYLQWKADMFESKVSHIANNGYAQTPAVRSNTRSFANNLCLRGKSLSNRLLDRVGARALAIWLMDAGSTSVYAKTGDVSGVRFHTEGFNKATCARLCRMLRRFNLKPKLGFEKSKYWTIRLGVEDSHKLLKFVAKYVHPSLKRKLAQFDKSSKTYVWDREFANFGAKVLCIKPAHVPYCAGRAVVYETFDIEVEDNHNFFVHLTAKSPRAIRHARSEAVLAHNCISQWSDSFRHHYAQLGDFSDRVKPKSLLLLTATAPDDVEQDVRRVMHAETAERVLYYPQRRNLVLSSKTYVGDHDILNFVNSIDGATIVYCSTVKKTEEMYAALCHHCKGRALVYNGTMKPDERATNQTMFMNGDVRVMFATKAFGLGINKANIRGVIHRDIPGSIDDLAQEMGRAGRDGLESQCRLYFEAKTYDTQKWFIDTAYPERSVITAVFRSIQSHLDDAGICKVTIENLSRHAGCQSAYCDSAIGILASSGVIDRNFDAGKIATAKMRKPHAEEECAFVMSTIERIGVKNGEGFDFNLETLIDVSGLKQKKVTDLLKLLDKEGYLTYIPPFRGKPTRIIGSLDMVDFDRIKVKRAAGMTKLNRVIHYHDTPDAKKHDFLQAYFGVKDSET